MAEEPDKAGWHSWEPDPIDGRPFTLLSAGGIISCLKCDLVKKAAPNRRVWLYKVDGRWTSHRPDCRIVAAEGA